mmetsp:Transcript_52659/g.94521  ORF Transcript_52659/g.94521 Transcript_52659/m.94521 type:complete len:237 (-) Transcript_52659:59-769(-)
MAFRACAITIAACVLLVHGHAEPGTATHSHDHMRHELDVVSSSGYLVQVPSNSSMSLAGWQKLSLATPVGLAAGWLMVSKVVLIQPSVHTSIVAGQIEGHGVPWSCSNTKSRCWFAATLVVLLVGMATGCQKRRKTARGRETRLTKVQLSLLSTFDDGSQSTRSQSTRSSSETPEKSSSFASTRSSDHGTREKADSAVELRRWLPPMPSPRMRLIGAPSPQIQETVRDLRQGLHAK